jgi:hypothetical protein
MLRVYLDQNKWIDLARAGVGRPDGHRFADVLTLATKGVDLHLVSFPLSAEHYMENANIKDRGRRHRLASTMAAFSNFDAIAGPRQIVPAEIDAALRMRFGRPLEPRTCRVFGTSLEHAFGIAPIQLRLKVELPADAKAVLDRAVQFSALGGRVGDLPVPEPAGPEWVRPAKVFREANERLGARFRAEAGGADYRSRVLHAGWLIDILDPVNEALVRAGIGWPEFTSDGEVGLTRFLEDLPTRRVEWSLHRLRHENPQTKWEENDLADITALAVAIVHCDVVVTERQWVHLVKRTGLDVMHHTRMLSDLGELAGQLVEEARV